MCTLVIDEETISAECNKLTNYPPEIRPDAQYCSVKEFDMKSSLLLPFAFATVLSCVPTRLETTPPSKKIDANWHSVSKLTDGLSYDPLGRPSYHRQKVRTEAQQAILVTESLGIKQSWWGYSGPENPHTRRLRFICAESTYSVPEPFVGDLLDLHVDFPTHASIDGNNQVFSMEGCGGEKCYTVHFYFRSGRFFQRILDYNEEHNIYIIQESERRADGNSR